MQQLRGILAMGLALLAAGTAMAQTGGLVIKVVDPDGDRLPGATVTISSETGFIKTTGVLTDRSGLAAFPVLRSSGPPITRRSHRAFGTTRLSRDRRCDTAATQILVTRPHHSET